MYKANFLKWILDGEALDIKTYPIDTYLKNNPDFDPDSEFIQRTAIIRQIELPFAPFIGLDVAGEFNGFYFKSGEIISITWDNDTQSFNCFLKSTFPTKSWNEVYDYNYNLKSHLERGWEISASIDDEEN